MDLAIFPVALVNVCFIQHFVRYHTLSKAVEDKEERSSCTGLVFTTTVLKAPSLKIQRFYPLITGKT